MENPINPTTTVGAAAVAAAASAAQVAATTTTKRKKWYGNYAKRSDNGSKQPEKQCLAPDDEAEPKQPD